MRVGMRARECIEALEAAPALGFTAFAIFQTDVQFKGRLDVYTS
jgi:hypothetical protein